ncbi:DoxX family protein [Nonomuraea sp. NEAU-A123]|uniref:DoxX family protein n=1 Tax=Nonomuraea sp. NEAU-A123 TaxID=2839649 RepID=UPI001BE494AA|nr:DoxX family protein [Nonomuraea sp. NEAU-A123]MBT2233123.1 DoxX family protein [Nonomuraea sp. NEAU-A123]
MQRIGFDLAALIARVAIGVIFVTHGWQKLQGGVPATAAAFAQIGVPMPQLSALFAIVVESVGGALLIIGLLVRLAALGLLIDMLGAIMFVHGGHGVMVQYGGWELAGALGVVCLLLVALGGGRIGIDGILHGTYRRRAERRAAEQDLAGHAPPTAIRPEADDTTPMFARPAGRDGDMRNLDDAVADEPSHRRPPSG